jgi:mannose-6-phosphate isomerase-like protein (cupin superfamily)
MRASVFTQPISTSPENRRGNGQVSRLLLAPGQFGSRHLAVTWVDAAPDSQQLLHAHPDSEQIYVIVRGRGRMIVAGEEQEVGPGTLVFIPPGAEHAIHNHTQEELVFVSAASPPWNPPGGEFEYAPARPA